MKELVTGNGNSMSNNRHAESQTLLAVIRPLDFKHPGHNLCRI